MKRETFVAFGDPHGDLVNARAKAGLLAFLADYKPDIVIHGGDNWDFGQIRNGASEADQMRALGPDWEAGNEFFDEVFEYGKTRILALGNHEHRLWRKLYNSTRAIDIEFAQGRINDITARCKRRNVERLPYDSRLGVWQHRGLKTIHGYGHGVYAARKFAFVYGTCIFFHTHSGEIGVAEKWPEPSIAVGAGALLNIDQPYNETQMNKLRHQNSFAYGYLTDDGPVILQAKLTKGGFYASTEIKCY